MLELFDVAPSLSPNATRNGVIGDAKHVGKLLMRHAASEPANLANRVWCQLRLGASLCVDLICYWLKMVGVHAQSNSAQMVNLRPFRDWPHFPLINHPVSETRLLVVPESAVSRLFEFPALPYPTRCREAAILLNPINRGHSFSVMSPAKAFRLPFDVSKLRPILCSNCRLASTSAEAKSRRIDGVSGIVWLRHLMASIQALRCAVAGAGSTAPGFSLPKLYQDWSFYA